MAWYRNFYTCPCGAEWEDEWSCMCDDDCPECGTTCTAHDDSEQLEDDEQETAA